MCVYVCLLLLSWPPLRTCHRSRTNSLLKNTIFVSSVPVRWQTKLSTKEHAINGVCHLFECLFFFFFFCLCLFVSTEAVVDWGSIRIRWSMFATEFGIQSSSTDVFFQLLSTSVFFSLFFFAYNFIQFIFYQLSVARYVWAMAVKKKIFIVVMITDILKLSLSSVLLLLYYYLYHRYFFKLSLSLLIIFIYCYHRYHHRYNDYFNITSAKQSMFLIALVCLSIG